MCTRAFVVCAFMLGLSSGCGDAGDNPFLPGGRDLDGIDGTPDSGTPNDQEGPGEDQGGPQPGGSDQGGADPGDGAGGNGEDPGGEQPNDGDPGDDPGDGDGGNSGAPHCMDGITDYKEKGPFEFETKRSGSVNFWIPKVPAGCKVPVVHLANGTGARCSSYGAILQHLASHGFLATCYENTNTGQGTQCIEAVETAFKEYPDLADNKIGSTGHSQGGGAAVVCTYRAEQKWGDSMIYAGHAMEPAHGYGDAPRDYASLYAQIKSPIFMFNGSRDSLVSASWVRQGFSALDDGIEAYWYEAVGAAHIPVPTSWTQESATVWFRWKLRGDKQACEYFKNMPNGGDWKSQQVQNETDC